MALEDLVQSKEKNSNLRGELKDVDDTIEMLKDKLKKSMGRKKELLLQLSSLTEENDMNEALEEKTKECEKLSKEVVLKIEMEYGVMRQTKEIEDRKKIEEDLNKKLKERTEEYCKLDRIAGHLESDLQECRDNERELERQIVILRHDLEVANEYKEKFKISSTKLEALLEGQKKADDKCGLGYEKGECFGPGQRNF